MSGKRRSKRKLKKKKFTRLWPGEYTPRKLSKWAYQELELYKLDPFYQPGEPVVAPLADEYYEMPDADFFPGSQAPDEEFVSQRGSSIPPTRANSRPPSRAPSRPPSRGRSRSKTPVSEFYEREMEVPNPEDLTSTEGIPESVYWTDRKFEGELAAHQANARESGRSEQEIRDATDYMIQERYLGKKKLKFVEEWKQGKARSQSRGRSQTRNASRSRAGSQGPGNPFVIKTRKRTSQSRVREEPFNPEGGKEFYKKYKHIIEVPQPASRSRSRTRSKSKVSRVRTGRAEKVKRPRTYMHAPYKGKGRRKKK